MTVARAGGWLRRRGAMHQQDGAGLAWPHGRVHGMRRARAMLAVHRVMSGGRDQCVQASMGPFIFCSRGLTRAGASAWLAEGREPPLAGRRHEPAVSAASRAPAHSESLAAAHARTPRALACCQELAAGVCAARPSQGRAGACSPVQHQGEEMPSYTSRSSKKTPCGREQVSAVSHGGKCIAGLCRWAARCVCETRQMSARVGRWPDRVV